MTIKISPDAIFKAKFFRTKRFRRIQEQRILIENNSEELVNCEMKPVDLWIDVKIDSTDRTLDIPAGGCAEVALRFDDTDTTFPKGVGPVDGAVKVHVFSQEQRGWEEEIPIRFQEVLEYPVFRGIFALDFGTTNSTAAVIDEAGHEVDRFELEIGTDTISSAIYFDRVDSPEQPSYFIGQDALLYIRQPGTPGDSYVFSVKRMVGTGAKHTILNRRTGRNRFTTYTFDQMARYIIERLLAVSEEKLGQTIEKVVLTYPAVFSSSRVDALRSIFVGDFGFRKENIKMDLDEASAAAMWFLDKQITRKCTGDIQQFMVDYPQAFTLLAYDFGGGTIDISLLNVSPQDHGGGKDPRFVIRTEVLGCTGNPRYGGDNVTLEVFKVLKWRLALRIAKYRPEEDIAINEYEANEIERAREYVRSNEKQITWAIENGVEIDKELARMINVLVPTQYAELVGEKWENARELFFEIWTRAEEIKHQLSDAANSQIGDKGPQMIRSIDTLRTVELDPLEAAEVGITMEELEVRIAEPIRKTAEQAKGLFERVALQQQRTPAVIRHVVLAGKSSNLPIVARTISRELQIGPMQIEFERENAKASVAIGACLAEQLKQVQSRYLFDVKTLVDNIPYDIGFQKIGVKGLQVLFHLGDSLPAKAVVENPGTVLKLFAQAGEKDEPVYLGQFNFSEPPAPPGTIKVAVDEQRQNRRTAQARESARASGWFSRRGNQQEVGGETRQTQESRAISGDKRTSVCMSADRLIYAEKGTSRWPLITPAYSDEIEANNVFSGRY